MYFDNYKNHPDAKINPKLFWDYDMKYFDYDKMRSIVVQRVIERGWPDDWYAAFNIYGVNRVVEAIKSIPYLNQKDINFASKIFDIPLTELKCFKKTQPTQQYWNS